MGGEFSTCEGFSRPRNPFAVPNTLNIEKTGSENGWNLPKMAERIFKLSRHTENNQGPAIYLDPEFILDCAYEADRKMQKENHPHQYELQKDLQCGYTLAMAIDPSRLEGVDIIATVYPKGITRTHARQLWLNWKRTVSV